MKVRCLSYEIGYVMNCNEPVFYSGEGTKLEADSMRLGVEAGFSIKEQLEAIEKVRPESVLKLSREEMREFLKTTDNVHMADSGIRTGVYRFDWVWWEDEDGTTHDPRHPDNRDRVIKERQEVENRIYDEWLDKRNSLPPWDARQWVENIRTAVSDNEKYGTAYYLKKARETIKKNYDAMMRQRELHEKTYHVMLRGVYVFKISNCLSERSALVQAQEVVGEDGVTVELCETYTGSHRCKYEIYDWVDPHEDQRRG